MAATVMWFRRDLRLSDNPALVAAASEAGSAGEVVALFCLDDRLWGTAGGPRRAFLAGCLADLDERIGGRLLVRNGDPADVVAAVANEVEAATVHIAADFGPYGRRRDEAVEQALAADGRELVRTGSPYAVDPGTVLNRSGEPYKVFTPFSKAWRDHGWDAPVRAPGALRWANGLDGDGPPAVPDVDAQLPLPGEDAAERAARRFWDGDLDRYDEVRDRPDLDATSRLSPYLRWGCIHPRQLLSKLGRDPGAGSSGAERAFVTELCWREFYADVLWHRPDTVHQALNPAMRAMATDTGPGADDAFDAWCEGRTGYPIVDAGMRQLRAEGFVHNRVRMLVASFLVKDLHLDWGRGARWFMAHLVDGDLASNHHGWQWVAGTGTDAAPYLRVFNPVTQGERFDPDGAYVRRWVPELADVPDRFVQRPWEDPRGLPAGYPAPIVDHAEERAEALRRYEAVRR